MKTVIYRLLVGLTFVLCVSHVKADDIYRFQSLTTRDGLSDNYVRCTLVDSRGLLWIGTDAGLDRYDGYEVKSMNRFLDASLALSPVEELQEDSEGKVWVFIRRSYVIYHPDSHTFSDAAEILSQKGVHVDGEFMVKVDEEGGLWILQDGSLSRYDSKKDRHETWVNQRFRVDDVNFHLFSVTSNGMVFVLKDGLWRFSRNTGKIERLELPAEMSRNDNMYGSFIDSDRTLWIYSYASDQLCRYNVGGKNVRQMVYLEGHDSGHATNNSIRNMTDDGKGNIWIATDHQGIYVYNKQNEQISNIRRNSDRDNTLNSNNVTFLSVDRQGTIWASHFKSGLSAVRPNSRLFTTKGTTYGDVTAVFADSKGRVWVGTDGNGLFVEHPDGTSQKTTLPNVAVMSVTEDETGAIWVGTFKDGAFQFHDSNRYEQYCKENGKLPVNNAWYVLSDQKGKVWCASSVNKLMRINIRDGHYDVVKDKNGSDILGNGLCLDGKGNMLVASTYGLVICALDNSTVERLTSNRSGSQQMTEKMLLKVAYDKQRDLALMIHRFGITIFDTRHDRIYEAGGINEGLKLFARSIVEDRQGKFWLSTASGISWIHIKNNVDGTLGWDIRNFTEHDGLRTQFYNASSAMVPSTGELLFCGDDGYTVVAPDESENWQSSAYTPVITDVLVGERSLPFVNGTVDLESDDNSVRIEFFPGDLNRAGGIQFAYQIKGVTSGWNYTNENHITLVGLHPGDYQLQLSVSDGGDAQSAECTLNIHVQAPFYLSTFACLLYALLLLCAVCLIWRRIRQEQKRKLHAQKELLERQKIVQITDMKLQFFTNISHDLRTPLTLIMSPIDVIVKKLENGTHPSELLPQLKNVRKNAQLLYNQVGSLLDFRRLDAGTETLQASVNDISTQIKGICLSFEDYAEEREITLTYTGNAESFMMRYDKVKISKIVYNLLSNAFKYTEAGGKITVRLQCFPEHVEISVADTGICIPDSEKEKIFHRFYQVSSDDCTQTGSGVGLHIVNEYVMMHNGTVSVRDNKPKGSVFIVNLPVDNLSHEDSSSSVPVSDAELDFPHVRKTVLVVDDNRDIVEFIKSSLQEDYEVMTAEHGEMALSIMSEKTVDLVVSDVMMPGIDGFELCKRIKSDINTSHIPVILLTARTTEESMLEGLQLGADDYIAKPFNMDLLALRIKKFMEWSEKTHQEFRTKVDVNPSEITITPLDEQFIQNAIKIVEEKMTDTDFSVVVLAQELCMSRSNLYKKLMAITGLGPVEFIRTIRVKRGRYLLENSQMQITEIAYAVGYNSLKSFSMNFKAEYGVTPSEFVKSRK